jgi:DNA repair exonuclease SbcCD nuclease subunit
VSHPTGTVERVVRFLHSADWQLGMTRHFLDADAQPRFDDARLAAVRSIGELATAEECGFVVVAGDVFETNHVARRVVTRALDVMGSFPSVTFFLLPGNHDPLDASSVFTSATFTEHRPANVVVLDDTTPRPAGAGVEIVGAPWTSKRPLGDLVDAALTSSPPDGTLRVIVGHGALDTLSPDRDDPALIRLDRLEATVAEGRAHYVALGDRHSTTPAGSGGRIWYSGAPEPTDFDEVDPGNVLLVELDEQRCYVEPRPVGTWRFVREHLELSSAEDVDRVATLLDELDDKPRCIVKLALVGQLSLAEMSRLESILEHRADLVASLQTWERRSELVALPDDDDFDVLGLGGFAAAALEDLRDGAAGDGADAVAARDALGLLYRLGSRAS